MSMTEAVARRARAVPEATVLLPGREVPIEAARQPGERVAAPEGAAAIPLLIPQAIITVMAEAVPTIGEIPTDIETLLAFGQ